MMNIELQHVNVKLFLRNAEGLKTGDYTGVFNGWIQTRALGELLVTPRCSVFGQCRPNKKAADGVAPIQ